MQDKLVDALLEKVKRDYATIAKRFSATRKNPWEEFVFFEPYLNKGDKLLDLGCGNGRLFGFLEDKNVDYIGIDNSEEMLSLARSLHPRANFKLGDEREIPLKNSSMDHVWNIAAFHHIPSKKLRLHVLSEIKRVLKPEGYLILTVWNLWQKKYRKYIYTAILRNIMFGEYEYNDTFIPWGKEKLVKRYYHAFFIKELHDLLNTAGFEIVDQFCSRKGKQVTHKESYNLCFIARKPKTKSTHEKD